jgi:cytochrome c
MQLKMLCMGLVAASSLLTNVATAEIAAGDFDAFNKYVTDNSIAPPCMTCHAVNEKKVGPSYNAVALKYKGQEDAAATLAKKITEGGSGVWGTVPMTPNASAKDHAETLAAWILALDPQGDDKTKAEEEIAAAPKAE